ncbi:hypothetical protein AB1K84_20700 [Mesobacillus foraminis]|uniref:hypothetical protein n=1 Tax=Mesobacillus foraminis TaxID=279826 RepID=UPI00399F4FCC
MTVVEEDIIVVETAAAAESKSAQNSLLAAIDKINKSVDRNLINEDINKSLAESAEAKSKMTRLIELFELYNNPKMPKSQLDLLKKQAQIALQQNEIVNAKLNEMLKTSSLATAKTLSTDALRASGYSLNYLEYIKANLIAYKGK